MTTNYVCSTEYMANAVLDVNSVLLSIFYRVRVYPTFLYKVYLNFVSSLRMNDVLIISIRHMH